MLHRELEQRVAAAQFQLEGDVVAVMLDRADADVQQRRDLAAGLPFGNQLQDATFGGRELRSVQVSGSANAAALRLRRMRSEESVGLTYSCPESTAWMHEISVAALSFTT